MDRVLKPRKLSDTYREVAEAELFGVGSWCAAPECPHVPSVVHVVKWEYAGRIQTIMHYYCPVHDPRLRSQPQKEPSHEND